MIVGGWAQGGERTTLDDLFRRAAVANPEDIALADDRRHLSYAEADRVIWAIASRLRAFELPTDAVIGMQLPNTVEGVLALLGILRAGMIAAVLPTLWRESEILAALSSVRARALLTSARIGNTDHAAVAMRVAAGLFSIRHVCAFGRDLPDGLVALDDVFDARHPASVATPRDGNPAAHAAIITFEPTSRGIRPVARNHLQLVAGGSPVANAAELRGRKILLSPIPLSSFAAVATALVPWLLSGARLVLQQPFEAGLFMSRSRDCDVIAVPGVLLPAFTGVSGTTLVAYWRSPERIGLQPVAGNVVDIVGFGEFGLHVGRRDERGRVAPMRSVNHLPGHRAERPSLLEAKRTSAGTLALRGGMVANTDAGAGPDSSDGFADTGYPCRIDADDAVTVTGPQPGMVSIGGYRIARQDLDSVSIMTPFGIISALPHALLGQRLAGASPEQSEIRAELEARGINALIARAFQHRAFSTETAR